jgi:hypothetical protein
MHRTPFTSLNYLLVTVLRRDKSWQGLQNWFSVTQPPTVTSPCLNSESPVLIPCHVQGAHWVALVRRVIAGRIHFFYADDLNSISTETALKNLFQTYADTSFYPRNSEWVRCPSITYSPHSNECGPRTLFALTVLGLHPQPHKNILLPFMDGNLAQILRTWVATTLMMGTVYIPTLTGHQTAQLSNHSTPRYLFHWNDPPGGAPTIKAPTPIQNSNMTTPSAGSNDMKRIAFTPSSTTNTKSQPDSQPSRKGKLNQQESIAPRPLKKTVTPKSAPQTTLAPSTIH